MNNMYEKQFRLLENKKMTLKELALELESVVGQTINKDEFFYKRDVALKPNTNMSQDTFHVTYEFLDHKDFIDVVASLPSKRKLSEYDFTDANFDIELISYVKRDTPENK